MGGKLPPFYITESDDSPTAYQPWKIFYPNGTVIPQSDGSVFIKIGTSIETTTSVTVSTYDVRTPLLAAGTVLFFNTNGNTANFLNGAGVFSVPSDVAYAPSGATYIIQTNNSVLSSAQILASLSTGLVKNTSVTGVLSIAVSGTDYEAPLTIGSPLLRSGNTVLIDTANSTKNGYLAFSDFNNFNAKVGSSRAITIVAPLSGGGDLSADRVIAILSSTATSDGYLKSADFSNFNAKANTSTTITVLSPLSGGGDISANRTIAFTTDGSTANFFRGDAQYAVPASNSGIKVLVFTVYSDDSWTGESIPIGQSPFETPITVRQVNVTTSGSSPTAAFNIEHRAWGGLGVSGTGLFSANQTATTTGFEATSFTSSNFAAKSHIFLTVSLVTIGQMDYITGSIYYTRNSV